MADKLHKIGTSIQDLGPLDGNGSIVNGLSVKCGKCCKRFMVQKELVVKLGSSIYSVTKTKELTCPYCSYKSESKPVGNFLSDTRPIGDY